MSKRYKLRELINRLEELSKGMTINMDVKQPFLDDYFECLKPDDKQFFMIDYSDCLKPDYID